MTAPTASDYASYTATSLTEFAASFDPPHGPGDARPTAAQVIAKTNADGHLAGKVILLTGATSGLGLETARALANSGAHLFLPVRNPEKGASLVAELQVLAGGNAKIDLLTLDLGSLASVRAAAAEFRSKSTRLDILINNAGVMATPAGERTVDGFDVQFGTNHLAHFLFFLLLEPVLAASSTPASLSRVVVLASSAHKRSPVQFGDYDFAKQGYDAFRAYGQAKTANIYFATEADRRYQSRGIRVHAVHPGGIVTPLQKHVDASTLDSIFFKDGKPIDEVKSPAQGAACTIWAATAPELEGLGGKYLEDCRLSVPVTEATQDNRLRGFLPYAYDQEAAARLWDDSIQLVQPFLA